LPKLLLGVHRRGGNTDVVVIKPIRKTQTESILKAKTLDDPNLSQRERTELQNGREILGTFANTM
jgi:hypothetical protein